MAKIVDRKITQNEFDTMASPLELDLISYFKLLEEAIMEQTFNKKQTPDELIENILEALIPTVPTGSLSVAKEDKPVSFVCFQGMMVGIENPKGTVRTGKDPNGHKWSIKMKFDYGFIVNTEAIDGDSMDVYLGNNDRSNMVYAVKQVDPNTKEFDEVKVMMGFDDKRAATLAYLSQYDNPSFFGAIVEYSMEDFKTKIFGGNND